ncbi:acetyl-CoA synthetase-like protein [Xylariaceae sp. FL0016]|nr:acetyl-CoA synthetase-like protein [Xylariaceae sp. FL0016]
MASTHSHDSRWEGDLLPHIVDRLARNNPDHVYGQWPIAPSSYDAGYRSITYAQLANIVNGLAWWIRSQLGPGNGETVLTYIGPNDVRYSALVLAAVKAGYVILLTTDPVPPPATAVIEAVKPQTLTIPSTGELLDTNYETYAYNETFQAAQKDPFIIMQVSCIPKPLIWTHGTSARHQNLSGLAAPHGVKSVDSLTRGRRVMVTLPPFHGAGVTQYLFNSIPFGNISIAPAATGIVTGHGLVEALQQTPADVALLVPSVVAEIAQDPSLLDYCARNLDLILYIGGDLPQAIGDTVAARIPLRCLWGASEVGIPQQLLPAELSPQDWKYVSFNPSLGAEFDDIADGVCELVIRRREALAETQALFTIRGQEKLEYESRTKDLFGRHPSVPNAWCWRARADDIIVFLNGEKTNPVSMEQHITAKNPELAGALVVGSQRFQAALLIEPALQSPLSTAEEAALIERVWPTVEEANQTAPAHARVEKSLILVTRSDRPFIRAGKGTIQRAGSLIQYSAEIDQLYANVDADNVSMSIRDAILSTTGWTSLGDSESFFDRGLDSLQALQVARAMRRVLHQPNYTMSTIYRNPTIKQLTANILAGEAPIDVLLTGSTGTLGTLILRTLLDRPGIGHVFCLNRAANGGRDVQTERLTASGLSTDGLDERVTFLQADLVHPSFALDNASYATLRARVGLIIHNAWPVNFNLSLSAFRPHLAGVVNLCALAAAAGPRAVRMQFVSSVGAVSGPGLGGRPAPETVLESFDTPGPNGYSKSKFLSELLCDAATQHLGTPVAVARVGQVAGAVRCSARWNPAEWLPRLVISAVHLGCLPDHLGPRFSEIDWVPSDVLAQALVDIAMVPRTADAAPNEGARVFNLRNPLTTSWEELRPAIMEAAKERGREVRLVTPSEWISRLQDSMGVADGKQGVEVAATAAVNPAIKLLDFYRDALWGSKAVWPPMSVQRAVQKSSALRELPAIKVDWMRKWVDEWLEQK